MDKTKQRIKIAEACGWKILWVEFAEPKYWSVSNGIEERKLAHYKTKEVAFILGVPDYLNDLNAMHAAEDHIPDKYDLYEYFLKRRLGDEWGYSTAEQRAEAFLRTLGLWEEPK